MCQPLNPVDEVWGQVATFSGLGFSASAVDDPGTPNLDERAATTETVVSGQTLVTGFEVSPGGGINVATVVVAIKNSMQPAASFSAPSALQYQRLSATVFRRSAQTVVMVMQQLFDGTPTMPSRCRVSFRLLPVGASLAVVVPDESADFDLQGASLSSQIFVAPSPSGRLIFMWRGVPPPPPSNLTAEHTVWRTDNGRTLMSWGGQEDGGTAAQPQPFRVCKVSTADRLISLWKSSTNDNAEPTFAQNFASTNFPLPRLSLSPQTVRLEALGSGGTGTPAPGAAMVTLRNDGNDAATVTLNLTGASLTLVQPPATPFCLDAGESRALSLRYAPASATDSINGSLQASSGAVQTSARIEGRVRAAPAGQPTFAVSPAVLVFPPTFVITKTIQISNTGSMPIEVQVPRGGQYGIDWNELPWTAIGVGEAPVQHPITHSATENDRVSANIRVRARANGQALPDQAITALANVTGISPGDLKILVIEANPQGDDTVGEYIGFINTTQSDIDLSDVTVEHETVNSAGRRTRAELYRFRERVMLPPYSFRVPLPMAVIRTGSGTESGLTRHANKSSPVWNNSGDTGRIWATLADGSRGLIDTATYGAGQFFFGGPQPYTPPPPRQNPPIVDTTISVPEASDWVDTGIDLIDDDRIDFFANGSIWAGVWLTGQNGPEGWEGWVQTGAQWPYNSQPDAYSFTLIGRIGVGGAPFRVGGRHTRIVIASQPERLFLRVNDDVPGNGSGAFSCRVVVRR
jgi:hypothetical protein